MNGNISMSVLKILKGVTIKGCKRVILKGLIPGGDLNISEEGFQDFWGVIKWLLMEWKDLRGNKIRKIFREGVDIRQNCPAPEEYDIV